jgi:competence protein ComEA
MFQKRSKLDSLQLIILGILLGLMAAGTVLIVAAPPRGVPVSLAPMPTQQPIIIHVEGAIAAPGVYSLPPGSRVVDAIEAAGGVLENTNYQSTNLARLIYDGDQIYIPENTSNQSDIGLSTPSDQESEHQYLEQVTYPININTAQASDLETLPGIGPQKALDIIAYREENGPFIQLEDIIKVNGIAEGTLSQIQELITVGP